MNNLISPIYRTKFVQNVNVTQNNVSEAFEYVKYEDRKMSHEYDRYSVYIVYVNLIKSLENILRYNAIDRNDFHCDVVFLF